MDGIFFVFLIAFFILILGQKCERTHLAEQYCTKTHELKAEYDACVENIEEKGFKE